MVWGIAPQGIDNTLNVDGDPIAAVSKVPLTFDTTFDLAKKETQERVLRHLGDLFDMKTRVARPDRADLVGAIKEDPLQALRDFCTPNPDDGGLSKAQIQSERAYCLDPDAQTELPTGDNFRRAMFSMLANGEGVVCSPSCVVCFSSLHFVCPISNAYVLQGWIGDTGMRSLCGRVTPNGCWASRQTSGAQPLGRRACRAQPLLGSARCLPSAVEQDVRRGACQQIIHPYLLLSPLFLHACPRRPTPLASRLVNFDVIILPITRLMYLIQWLR
jgi:hypothetical protein